MKSSNPSPALPALTQAGDVRNRIGWVVFLTSISIPIIQAQSWLDAVDDRLHVATPDGSIRVDLSGLADLEFYHADSPPPALLYAAGDLFNPRLTFFLDAHFGKHLYAMTQARIDRGFDPLANPDGDARFDEYLVRYTPFADTRVNLQIGKFATVVGNWVPRHLSWDNPLINAPLPYENVMGMTDRSVPPGPAVFLGRKSLPDRKTDWLSLVWGPSYAAGASAFGSLGRLDYAFEIKNAALSSRPEYWDPFTHGWDHPTLSGRLGWRPNTAWALGVSGSGGSYLQPVAADAAVFPSGGSTGDYTQLTVAFDAGYAWHRLQLWSEVYLSRFEVPHVGDADTLAYYLEAKYKLTTGLFAAARWNQQFFGEVADAQGGRERWDDDAWRIDLGLGYRFTRHLQAKVLYSFNREDGAVPVGDHVLGAQVTAKF